MEPIAATLAVAVGLFAGTNVDDMIVLAVLNVSARADGRPKPWQIWVGQYTGITALVGASLLAAVGLTLLPDRWIWLLGLIPLALGVGKLVAAVRARRSSRQVSPAVATGLTGVIALTIANGGDNIAAYTPVLRTLDVGDTMLTLVVFAVGTALWCLAGAWLVSHQAIAQVVQRWGHWIIPAVFIAIGLYIFAKGGILG